MADNNLRIAGEVRFSSSGFSCKFALTMPAVPAGNCLCAVACLCLPVPPDQTRSPARIARAVDTLNSRTVGVTAAPDKTGGHIALRSSVQLGSCNGLDEPSKEQMHALSDAITDMASNLLAIGDDWWNTCANLGILRTRD